MGSRELTALLCFAFCWRSIGADPERCTQDAAPFGEEGRCHPKRSVAQASSVNQLVVQKDKLFGNSLVALASFGLRCLVPATQASKAATQGLCFVKKRSAALAALAHSSRRPANLQNSKKPSCASLKKRHESRMLRGLHTSDTMTLVLAEGKRRVRLHLSAT